MPIESKYTVSNEKSYSYLDLFGRPTVVITMKNVYDIHKVNFQIYYKFNPIWLLIKPTILIGFIFAFFVLVISYFRLELSLKKKSKIE